MQDGFKVKAKLGNYWQNSRPDLVRDGSNL